MTRTLHRACLGCGTLVRGKPRCHDCERDYQRAKRAKRPDLYNNATERRRRAMAVADWRALLGDWCPGWQQQPAHPSADLTADHIREVAAGGKPNGRLVVRCRSCNAARSAHLARRALTQLSDQRVPPISAGQTTPRQPKPRYESVGAAEGVDDRGPAVA